MPGKKEEKGVRGKGERWVREVRRARQGYEILWLKFEIGEAVGGMGSHEYFNSLGHYPQVV